MRPVLLLLLGSISVFAQPFSAGIKAGVPLTDFLTATENGTFNITSTTQRYIIGGEAELHLPLGLGVEFDVLYRRLSYNGSGDLLETFTTASSSGSNWEFPLLLKYRFHFPVARPFVDAGVAWDDLTGLKTVGLYSSAIALVNRNTTSGIVFGGGVDIHAIVMHISPEIRYTRWTSAQLSESVGLLHSNLNQAEFLVGFTF